MKNVGALKPEVYQEYQEVIKKQAQAEAERMGIDKVDQDYTLIYQCGGWQQLVSYINNLKKELDDKLHAAISAGMGEDEVGKRAIIATITKDCLDSVVSRVESSALAVEQIQDERRNAESDKRSEG